MADRCVAEIRSQASMLALGSVPLFLVMICIAFEETGRVAPNRAELYRTAVDALLTKWDVSRSVLREEPYPYLTSPRRKRELLSELAAATFEKAQYWFDTRTACKYISDFMARMPQHTDYDPERILEIIEAHHGILMEQARGIHGFSHLTLQEYLTAEYIIQGGKALQERMLQAYGQDSRWREVIILVATLLPDASDFMLPAYQPIDPLYYR